MSTKACTVCGAGAQPNSTRCRKHPKPGRNPQLARNVVRAALVCAICGKPGTRTNPLVADHIVPLARGGIDTLGNLRAVHQSWNSRGGANITNAAA